MAFDAEIRQALIDQVRRFVTERCIPLEGQVADTDEVPQDVVEENRLRYQSRRDVMVESFTRAGWPIPNPPASMFTWAELPPGFEDMGSLEFSKQLLEHAGVAVAAGVGFGEEGEGFVRIAMVENEQRIRQAARNVKRFLQREGS